MKSKYSLFIPHVNDAELTLRAIRSARVFNGEICVINNGDLPFEYQLEESGLPASGDAEVNYDAIENVVPLTFSQTMNQIFGIARAQGADICYFLHNDGEIAEGTAEKLKEMAETTSAEWGAIFTFYDVFAAFNMKAVEIVGPWDQNFAQYFADNDYYRRLRLAGKPCLDSGLPVKHINNGSNTLAHSYSRFMSNDSLFPAYQLLYERKWGGKPGEELFLTPYNKALGEAIGVPGFWRELNDTRST